MTACSCKNWASTDLFFVILTGHHENCPKANIKKSSKALIQDLVRGMEHWAADEDGVHPEAWKAYTRAKSVIGEFIAEHGGK